MRILSRCIVLSLITLPGLAGAEVYRWVDEGGRVHFSQTPPPKGEYGRVNPSAPPPGSSPNLDALREHNEAADKAREKGQREAQKAEQEQARRQQQCSQARQRQAYYESTGRIFSIDENGKRTYLNSQQVDQRRADARAAVDERCQ